MMSPSSHTDDKVGGRSYARPPIDEILRFDEIGQWAWRLDAALEPLLSDRVRRAIVRASPEFVEDARDILLAECGDGVIDSVLAWITSYQLAGYHGTRLTEDEAARVSREGLVPLQAQDRRGRLERALARHPRWADIAPSLDGAIDRYGREAFGGKREGQVHLTHSRAGLVENFNHYLRYGSEFDQCIARELLPREGLDCLARDGVARVIEVAVPGDVALAAAHPFFTIEHKRANQEVPNIVDQVLSAWSFRLVRPDFDCSRLKLDCGMVFRSTVPAAWIVQNDRLSDSLERC